MLTVGEEHSPLIDINAGSKIRAVTDIYSEWRVSRLRW
jgi:hypothetical protein